jgi:hypothetical protein
MTAPDGLMTEAVYVTLSTTGAGSGFYQAKGLTSTTIVEKITLTCAVPGGCTATISRDGRFLTGGPFASYLEAKGSEEMSNGQIITVDIRGGPPGAVIGIVFHYWERPL